MCLSALVPFVAKKQKLIILNVTQVQKNDNFDSMKMMFLSLLVFLAFSCSRNVEKFTVKNADITESVYASGAVKSENQYQVFPKMNGILESFFVEEGDLVNMHQILFSIANETSKLSRENAQLLANFNDYESNKDKLADLKMNIELAKTKMHNDSINYLRQKSLFEKNVISKTTFEQIELSYQNSRTTYQSAKFRYDELRKQLAFSDQQSKRNLMISQNMESDFLVKSELKGRVYAILKEKGEMVNQQTPIAILGDAENFKIDMQIDENDIIKVKKGQKIIIALDSYKNESFEAIVTKINPYLNEKSKTFTIEGKFTQKPTQLYPNLTLEANIIVAQKSNVLVIPRKFLLEGDQVELESGEKVKVKTGLKDFEKVEVLSGISAKDVLVIDKK